MDKILKRILAGKAEFKDGFTCYLADTDGSLHTATWKAGDKISVEGLGNEVTLKRLGDVFSVKAKRL